MKMLYDLHIHTRYSTDSRMGVEEVVARAEEQGIGVAITEHMDLDYPQPEEFVFDVAAYLEEYAPYRGVGFLQGVEVGMRVDLEKENRRLVGQHAFDFVIGSVHVIDRIDLYCESFYRQRSKKEVYGIYFDAMLQTIRGYDFVDTLGHIDYICRYARYADPELYYGEFAEAIDPVLQVVAERGKAMEINTRRLGQDGVEPALLRIYQRFAELGGKYVTLGSDAHIARDVGKGIRYAAEMAAHCGLQPVLFRERNMEIVHPG